MDYYIVRLLELEDGFSYQEFISILNDLDKDIINHKIDGFNKEFMDTFMRFMRFINDIDGKCITLGDFLMEQSLKEGRRISPTLLCYFYLKNKNNLGLNGMYDDLRFSSNKDYHMVAVHPHDSGLPGMIEVNMSYYDSMKDNSTFNYSIMHDILHELTHVYQMTRSPNSSNDFERATYYDTQMMNVILNQLFGGIAENALIHDSFPSEQMADEQADVFMLNFAEEHPEFFSEEVINQERQAYQSKKGTDFYQYPHKSFADLLEYLKMQYEMMGIKDLLDPVMKQVTELMAEQRPALESLMDKGILESPGYSNVNIFLNALYKYNGNTFTFDKPNEEVKLMN